MSFKNRININHNKTKDDDMIFHFKIGTIGEPDDVDEIIVDYSENGPNGEPIITEIPAKKHS
jgi:hypothetical protein